MKRFRTSRVFCFVLFSLSAFISRSQDWRIEKTLQGDSIGFVALRYQPEEKGLAAIDAKGLIKWQIPVPGLVIGMGTFKNNLLLFYTSDYKYGVYKDLKDIHAALVNSKQKKIISDKIIFTNSDKPFIDAIVLNDPSGNFNCLLLRNTGKKPSGAFSYSYNSLMPPTETAGLSFITLTDDMKATHRDLNSASIGGSFVSACSGWDHDFYISAFVGGQLVTEKFNAEGKQVLKLTAAAASREAVYVRNAIMNFDSLSGSAVNLLIRYETDRKKYVVNFFRFDFDSHKAIAAPEVALDKDYEKQLKEGQPEKVKSSNLKRIEDLEPVQILETKDKIIVLKEIQYTYSLSMKDAAPRYSRADAIVSVYTKQLHLVKEFFIDKYVETFLFDCNAIGGHIKNSKLFLATMQSDGVAAIKDVLYTINLDDATVTEKLLDRKGAAKSFVLETPDIYWFPESFVMPLVDKTALFSSTYTTKLQTVPYE